MKATVTIPAVLLAFFLVFTGCEKFEFDPNQSVDLTSKEQLNYTNINMLRNNHADSSVRFVLMGDSHIDYANMEKLTDHLNEQNGIDFLVHAGDLTEHGILQQYKQTSAHLGRLKIPYVTVIGNHDIVGNGEAMYRHMFGRTDYSFVYAGIKFVFFNDNSREYGFNGKVPDLSWVSHEIADPGPFSRVVLVSHVPYFDKDFDQALRDDYIELLSANRGKVLLSLNGHLHDGFVDIPENTDVLHLGAGSVNRRSYIIITINGNDVSYEKKYF
jgi:Icc protein